MKPVFAVVGTRPEAIKMFPVIRALRARPDIRLVTLVTGQHREMLDQAFECFSERPDIDLNLMTSAQSLSGVTAQVLEKIAPVLAEYQPCLVLVHGDTTTAMAAALAAFYARIPVAHVEAGLRSNDLQRPWPEEFNRLAIDAIADLLFAPTESAAANLRRESPRKRSISVTGNTGIDALLQVLDTITGEELSELGLSLDPGRRMILVTGHRRENFGQNFNQICEAITTIAKRGDVDIVCPVHLNPEVRDAVHAALGGRRHIYLIPPVSHVQMAALMKKAVLILTDSGGVQEEAPALGTPVLVTREVTERPEALETGVATLVGTNPLRIVSEVTKLLDDPQYYAGRARRVFPYGDGRAAERIAESVAAFAARRS